MKNVFAKGISFDDHFLERGKEILVLYKTLIANPDGILFEFTTDQEKTFLENYTKSHEEFFKSLGDNSIASVRRLALINFRIAMILSMLRVAATDEIPVKIICQDIDFENAFRITEVLKDHARKLFLMFPAGYTNPYGLKGNILNSTMPCLLALFLTLKQLCR